MKWVGGLQRARETRRVRRPQNSSRQLLSRSDPSAVSLRVTPRQEPATSQIDQDATRPVARSRGGLAGDKAHAHSGGRLVRVFVGRGR